MATLIFPWRGGCPHRERARAFLERRYDAATPAWERAWADAPPGPWSKARAVLPALRRADSGAVVVADADVWVEPGALASAVRAVTVGAAAWAMPHRLVLRLTRAQTDRYIGLDGADPDGRECERAPYEGIWGGGIVVAHRDVLLDAPLDPRFEGWGGEDESWAMALQCLHGPGWRGTADLLHLWHPPQERPPGKFGRLENRALRRRYGRAGLDPAAMREILTEAHGGFDDVHQHALHDRPARLVG